jgi:hypothetical protein
MGHRIVADERGRRWEIWDVQPSRVERRLQAERDEQNKPGEERRHLRQPRVRLPETLREGWLAFQTDGEMKRLAPIPTGWESFSDEVLRGLMAEARAVWSGKVPVRGFDRERRR